MASLKEKNKISDAEKEQKVIELTPELVANIKESYLNKLIASGRDLLKNQFMSTTCNAKDETTFECICTMHLQYNSINNLKQDLADFIIQKTGNPKIKVLTVLEEQELPEGERVLDKNEIFELYGKQFPLLKMLKDELHLSIKSMHEYTAPVVEAPVITETNHTQLEDDNAGDMSIDDNEE